MDFSKVKLVVSDMDGTLLDSNHEVSSSFFALHEGLKKNNIHFVAASGRQYDSILDKLAIIKNDITIVAENGGVGKLGDEILFSCSLELEKIHRTLAVAREIENPYIVLCGLKAAYVETKDQDFIAMFSQFYSSFKVVDDLSKVTDDTFFKLAIYHKECSETYIYPTVSHLSDEMQVIVSGKNWLDISHNDANKGKAIAFLQEKYGITKEETMVFGDYNNDLKMLELADFSFAMENAHPNVKEVANYETLSNDNRGVDYILEKMLKARS